MRTDDDARRIDLDKPGEIEYLAEKFGVSRVELRMGVQKAGPYVRHVAALLGKKP